MYAAKAVVIKCEVWLMLSLMIRTRSIRYAVIWNEYYTSFMVWQPNI